jgi:hypothetical protein
MEWFKLHLWMHMSLATLDYACADLGNITAATPLA